MTVLVFTILFGLSFVVFPCEGEIFLPPEGDVFLVAPGTDVKIAWRFDDNIADLITRLWRFGPAGKILAKILGDQDAEIEDDSGLPGVLIEKPSTLVLKNVGLRYNGTYIFQVQGKKLADPSYVTVLVAVKPTMTVCSTPITVDEDENVTCLCQGKNGQPPANVTWYNKIGVQIGDTGDEVQTLSLSKVNENSSGTYKCVGQSFTLKAEKSIEVIVRPNIRPTVTSFTSGKAVLGKSVTLTCEAEGRPSPSYTIIHNDTRQVSNEKTYKIDKVKYNDAGLYKCTAKNKLGDDSEDYSLTVLAKEPESKPEESSGLSGGAIAGIVIGALLLLVIIIVVVWWCKFRGNKNEDRRTGVSESGNRNTPIYADVRKDPKKNEPTYAVLDKNALQTGPDASVKRDSGEPTQYADIEFGAVRGDLV